MKITDDTVTISLKNASVVDQFRFPGGAGNSLGIAGVPATLSFDITYSKSGDARHVKPTTTDPLSPFNWAGEMWEATNSGTFSLSYNDGTFSAEGSFDSAGNFGEMGFERNGSFVEDDRNFGEHNRSSVEDELAAKLPATLAATHLARPSPSGPKFRGKIPISELIH
ncbi:MAG TPA: hypothetical protein VJN90_03775 [Candidatus Acidoferrales bacterium]|nr:hypothetical protein [Candidatus Acidoferrales bacterium]